MKESFTVIAVDRRGYGTSPLTKILPQQAPEPHVLYRIKQDAQDIAHLAQHLSDAPVYILGSSSGAIVAMHVLEEYPEFEESEKIYSTIVQDIDLNNSEEMEYWNDLINACSEYTKERSSWLLLSKQQRIDRDKNRSAIHDGLLVKLNIIKRLFESKNLDVKWFNVFKINSDLGDEKENIHRKRVGDLANYIAYIYAINSR